RFHRLYGPVYAQSDPVVVHITTSMRNGRPAFALWWGTNSKRNCAYALESSATEARAGILAVLCAAQLSPRDKNLIIYVASEYVVRSFCYWAGDNETMGWSCANGEELRDSIQWLAYRHAPTQFRWVSSKSGN
ncbi:hypothetical protein DFH07DRAFT_684491, partial [Mycena maculata]